MDRSVVPCRHVVGRGIPGWGNIQVRPLKDYEGLKAGFKMRELWVSHCQMTAQRAVRSGITIKYEGYVGGNQLVRMSGDKRREAVPLHEVLKHRELLYSENAWQIHDYSILPELR